MDVTSLGRDNPMIRYDLEDVISIDPTPCECGETSRRAFWLGRGKDVVRVGGRIVLPVDVWQALPADAEFVLVRPSTPTDELVVRIEEPHVDADTAARLTAAAGVPVKVEPLAAGTLPRAAYKSQRVV